ncbi:HupE / UreJ protein [Rhodoferax sp. OV413]|uniref:HupE/UreJ family protein n=1 Tax=Rhodoferax sp. OV413 TaxID=1855285 RepID=UPI00088DB013|nr:HupE/UreJ family protein [Rhodoferax sp. OV413]SDP48145.1 HupE / UreJ protein [Rhodoferax sp. OV413]
MKYLIAILCAALLVNPAWAHKGSDAYLDVRQTEGALNLQLSVALKDLDLLLPIDANADGQLTWAEVQAATPAVLALLQTHTGLDAPTPGCALQWRYDGLERRSDGAYLRASSPAHCAAGSALGWRYSLFKAEDANHRLIVTGQLDGHDLLATTSPQQTAPLPLRQASAATPRGILATVFDYLALGMHHLLEGYDHMAFLLALVLPLQLRLARGVAGQANPWWALLRTITAFTIGHSITLVLATLGVTEASPVWVEPVIAASIGVTALLNLYPVPVLRPERLALAFGLVHGYGFAGLLIEAAAPAGLLPWALAGFNLGVEAGQLTAVAGWVLLSQLLVRQPWYERIVVRGGSRALLLLASYWVWQRVF